MVALVRNGERQTARQHAGRAAVETDDLVLDFKAGQVTRSGDRCLQPRVLDPWYDGQRVGQRRTGGVAQVVDHAVHALVQRDQLALDPVGIRDPHQEAAPTVLNQSRWCSVRRTHGVAVLVDPNVDQHERPQQSLHRGDRRLTLQLGQPADHFSGQWIAEVFQFAYGAGRGREQWLRGELRHPDLLKVLIEASRTRTLLGRAGLGRSSIGNLVDRSVCTRVHLPGTVSPETQ